MKTVMFIPRGAGAFFFSLLFVSLNTLANSVALSPAADASLMAVAPDNNNGGEAWVLAGVTQNSTKDRGLFRFDLTADLPPGALIQSASLVLEVTKQPPSSDYRPAVFGLHRVLQPWGEGNKIAIDNAGGQGAPADPNEVTWNSRFAFTSETWAVPGGAPGIDFVAAASAEQTLSGVGQSPYTFPSTPALVADVQNWVNNPASNNGWMLMGSTEQINWTTLHFGSRENPDAAPILNIEYTAVPEPSSLALLGTGFAALCWTRWRQRGRRR